MIIGAQKCGTTWLHQMLAQHPQVLMPEGKDDEHFSYLPEKSLDAYFGKFATAAAEQTKTEQLDTLRIGDSCASYFWSPRPGDTQPDGFHPNIPELLERQLNAQCRYIVMLKDPVQRTLSAYLHHIAHQSLACNRELLSAPDTLGLLALSRYGHHLQHWLQHIPAERLLILPAPNKANAQHVLQRCCDYLNIDSEFHFSNSEHPVFSGLRRQQDANGLWVMVGQRGIEDLSLVQRPVPLVEQDGQQWVRLVHPEEIQQVRNLLAEDTALFAQLLQEQGYEPSDFEHWQSWP